MYYLDKREKTVFTGDVGLEFPEHIEAVGDEIGAELWEGALAGKSIELDKDGPPYLVEHRGLTLEETQALRQAEYNVETDPLVIEAIREIFADDPRIAEVNKKVAEIKARYPKPAEE